MQRLLIGFHREEVVGTELLDDQSSRLRVGVQGIEH